MKARAKYVSTQVLVLLLSVSVLFAQETVPLAPAPMQAKPVFTQQQLDQMLAPVALYPDSLLSQILMASTYPPRDRRGCPLVQGQSQSQR